MKYSDALEGLTATTRFGETGRIIGPARDPQRCTFLPRGSGRMTFTPQLDHLTLHVGYLGANRLATVAERADAWDTLMSSTEADTDRAVMAAADHLSAVVAARVGTHR